MFCLPYAKPLSYSYPWAKQEGWERLQSKVKNNQGTSGVMHAELAEMQRRRFAPESVDRHEDLFHHMARTLSIKNLLESSTYCTVSLGQRSGNDLAGTMPDD